MAKNDYPVAEDEVGHALGAADAGDLDTRTFTDMIEGTVSA